jgi:hypothetical protein
MDAVVVVAVDAPEALARGVEVEGANAEGGLDALGRLRGAQLAAGRHDPGRDPQPSRELLVGSRPAIEG